MKKIKIFLVVSALFITSLAQVFAQNEYRDRYQRPEAIMDTVGVKPGMKIGEAGAGDGYLTFWLSKRVGENGKIYANDISSRSLKRLEERCEKEKIRNIETVGGKVDDPLFPVRDLDLIILIQAFHDFEKPVKWLDNAIKYMKPGARLVIVDKDPDRWGQGHSHFMTKEKLLETVKKSDFVLERMETFLEQDNIYIFSQKE